ncbi:3-oxoacyl-[acyl-carrier protein] reductase [Bacilli bacterium PM5-3]|nr:3-oxoacyl-[acyl-carrier protein] reductase [Bacilli bacterium PM5-3]
MSKCAIITGGVQGIGKAIANQLKNDYKLVLTYVGTLENEQELINEYGKDNVLIIKADVTNEEDCQMVINKSLEFCDDIEILVNNAGITKDNLLLKMSSDDFKKVIDVNLVGSFNMIKAVQRKMIKQKYGRIINISSVIGITGNIGQANYAASKAGLIGLSKSVAKELASRNITVNCVAPGFIATDMTDVLDNKVVEQIKTMIPSKKLGGVDDVANAVSFLASKQSSYITGQVINVCGGMVM